MRCPFATWRPIPENDTQPRITPRVAIVHSAAADTSSLWSWFARRDVTLEAHFFVKWDGTIEQYLDTEVRGDANRYANEFAVSIETEDDGKPDSQPWSDQQLAALTRLLNWLMEVHPRIQRQRCQAWNGSGIGYHTMWGAPSEWTPVKKSCPGAVRIRQFANVLLPALLNPWTHVEVNDDMDRTCIPSWVKRQSNGRMPFLKVDPAPDLPQHAVRVLAMPGCPLKSGLTAPHFRYTNVYGIPALEVSGLAAPVVGIEEHPTTGAVLLLTADGGTFDVAARP